MDQDSYNNDDKDASQVTDYDMDKLRSTIKQFVREWAIEVKHSTWFIFYKYIYIFNVRVI